MDIWLLENRIGRTYKEDLKINVESDEIYAHKKKWRHQAFIGYATDGTNFLNDMQRL